MYVTPGNKFSIHKYLNYAIKGEPLHFTRGTKRVRRLVQRYSEWCNDNDTFLPLKLTFDNGTISLYELFIRKQQGHRINATPWTPNKGPEYVIAD